LGEVVDGEGRRSLTKVLRACWKAGGFPHGRRRSCEQLCGTSPRVTNGCMRDRQECLSYFRSRINIPAAIARMANPIEMVEEIVTLSKGKSPVRINQIASRIMPRFLPAKLFESAM